MIFSLYKSTRRDGTKSLVKSKVSTETSTSCSTVWESGGLVTLEADSSHTLNRLQGEREVPAWDGSHSGNRLSHANCSFDPLTLPLNVLWWVFVGNSVRLAQH